MSSILTIHLKQETPMWHFQCRDSEEQKGAILRGSDVKPRLDRFLIDQMDSVGISWGKYRISPDHDALNYRIQIHAIGRTGNKDLGNKAFFANMGRDVDSEHAVFYPQGVDVKIVCFIPDLMEQIKKHVKAFFLINNFGTRANKGFGSFSVDKMNDQTVSYDVASLFAEYSTINGKPVYSAFIVNTTACSDKFKTLDNAYVLYQWMKSGINFGKTYKKSLLTRYMLKKKIGGEKRWMKEKDIAPKVRKGENRTIIPDDKKPKEEINESRYIRAVLGVSGIQSWVSSEQNGTDKKGNPKYSKYNISISSEEVERFQSPITIRVVGDSLYFLAYELTGFKRGVLSKEFNFENKKKQKKGTLTTLSEFDMGAFMDYCAAEVNKEDTFNISGSDYKFEMQKITGGDL